MFLQPVRGLLHHPERDQLASGCSRYRAALAIPGRPDQHPVRDLQHQHPGRQLIHLPDGRVRRRARPGQTICGLFNLRRWGLREWYTLTFLMGAFFIGGQAYEYAALFHEGLTISSNVFGSVFSWPRAFYGLHVTGGLFAFLLVMGRTFLARTFTHEQAVTAVVVSYYWHFVDVVWIALFGVIYIPRDRGGTRGYASAV